MVETGLVGSPLIRPGWAGSEIEFELIIPPHLTGNTLRLTRRLLLTQPPAQLESPLIAHIAGSILWSEESLLRLAGTGAAFPVEIVDFSKIAKLAKLTEASWYLDLPVSVDTPVLGGLLLLVNALDTTLVSAVTAPRTTEVQQQLIRSMEEAVAEQMIRWALSRWDELSDATETSVRGGCASTDVARPPSPRELVGDRRGFDGPPGCRGARREAHRTRQANPMSELWPRLGAAASRIEFEAMRSMDPARLPSRLSPPQQTFAATGGTRVNVSKIIELVSELEGLAIQRGYPNQASAQDRIAFDRAAAETLLDATNMTAFEASQPGVWNFVALVAMPKVTRWRFGSGNPERWIASDLTRHMFSRLWWQAFTFGVVQDEHHRLRASQSIVRK